MVTSIGVTRSLLKSLLISRTSHLESTLMDMSSVNALEKIIIKLEADVAALETATVGLIAYQLGEVLEIDTEATIRERIKFITASIVSIT